MGPIPIPHHEFQKKTPGLYYSIVTEREGIKGAIIIAKFVATSIGIYATVGFTNGIYFFNNWP